MTGFCGWPRTIADLDGAPEIGPAHLAEAIQFRNTDILKG